MPGLLPGEAPCKPRNGPPNEVEGEAHNAQKEAKGKAGKAAGKVPKKAAREAPEGCLQPRREAGPEGPASCGSGRPGKGPAHAAPQVPAQQSQRPRKGGELVVKGGVRALLGPKGGGGNGASGALGQGGRGPQAANPGAGHTEVCVKLRGGQGGGGFHARKRARKGLS